jgi:hypothetical protein
MPRDGAGRKSAPRSFTMCARNWSIRRLASAASAPRRSAAQLWIASRSALAASICACGPERSGFYERPGWIPIERDVGERHPSAFIRDAIPETKINRSPP